MTTIGITGHTRFYGLIGSPVAHSFSPTLHNQAFQEAGIDAVYLCFDVKEEELEQAVTGLVTAGIQGFNLTMPCKNKMLSLCHKLSPAATLIGAVNTVTIQDGIMTGHNTDGIGFWRAASESGCSPSGKTVTLMGMGGAATAIAVEGALNHVAELNIFVRSSSRFWKRAIDLAKRLNKETSCHVTIFPNERRDILKDCVKKSHLLVNGTSLGMDSHTEQTILPEIDFLHPDLIVGDVIYHPQETLFLRNAHQAGCKTFNGLPMLLYQGAEAFRLWTGKSFPSNITLKNI